MKSDPENCAGRELGLQHKNRPGRHALLAPSQSAAACAINLQQIAARQRTILSRGIDFCRCCRRWRSAMDVGHREQGHEGG